MNILNHIGCHYKENTDFVIDRPRGSMDFLFLVFHSTIHIQINGNLSLYPANTCILYEPHALQLYSNKETGFLNDWIHFDGKDVLATTKKLAIPLNVPFIVHDVATLQNTLKAIEKENLMKALGYQHIIHLKIEELFIDMARAIHETKTIYKYNTNEASFRNLRSEVMSSIEKKWTVDTMASKVGLSRSRFSHLYKEVFHISPKEDLINERMTMAKYLLSVKNMQINEIASRVGYDNIFHFSKQFKSYSGDSPSNFRRFH